MKGIISAIALILSLGGVVLLGVEHGIRAAIVAF